MVHTPAVCRYKHTIYTQGSDQKRVSVHWLSLLDCLVLASGVVMCGEVGIHLIYGPQIFFKVAHPTKDKHPVL